MTDLVTLSKLLKVPPSTISRVLNRHPSQRISETRRTYIMEGAQKYGYRPSIAARSLTKKKTFNVALVMHYQTSATGVVNPNTIMEFMMSLERVLQENHYGLSLVFISRDQPELSFSRLVTTFRSFDALVFPTRVATKGIIDFAVDQEIPTAVIFDKQSMDWPINGFNDDELADIRQAVAHLVQMGHRKIGVVCWDTAGRFAEETFSLKARDTLTEQGLPVVDAWIVTVDTKKDDFLSFRDHGRQSMKKILSADDRPTAIVASNDMCALGVIDVMRERDLAPGRDIAVVGHGNLEGLSSYDVHEPILTTFEPPYTEVGRAAAEALLAQINDKTVPSRHKLFAGKLIVRSSTKA